MAVAPSDRIGPYEVVAPIGAGGMGEVFRARDVKLQRDVAIKILPERFAADPSRLARFEREARALAALNHSNIAQIFGFEQAAGVQAFVMELVDGRTLDHVISAASNGLPLRRALTIAAQIASAVEAAHERGILHRDLKPVNIKVTESGVVKVLDFGLAAMADRGDQDGASQPTRTAVTEHGAAVGTPAYMSPEQARGEPVDRRTDVWAFGCVLFEMLSGCRAFAGKSSSDTIAAVLTRDPDWSAMPAGTPSAVSRLIKRCLQKDVDRRLRDMGDARLDLEESSLEPGATPTQRTRKGLMLALALTAVALGALTARYTDWGGRRVAAP